MTNSTGLERVPDTNSKEELIGKWRNTWGRVRLREDVFGKTNLYYNVVKGGNERRMVR